MANEKQKHIQDDDTFRLVTAVRDKFPGMPFDPIIEDQRKIQLAYSDLLINFQANLNWIYKIREVTGVLPDEMPVQKQYLNELSSGFMYNIHDLEAVTKVKPAWSRDQIQEGYDYRLSSDHLISDLLELMYYTRSIPQFSEYQIFDCSRKVLGEDNSMRGSVEKSKAVKRFTEAEKLGDYFRIYYEEGNSLTCRIGTKEIKKSTTLFDQIDITPRIILNPIS